MYAPYTWWRLERIEVKGDVLYFRCAEDDELVGLLSRRDELRRRPEEEDKAIRQLLRIVRGFRKMKR
jgi:hypothetical protein